MAQAARGYAGDSDCKGKGDEEVIGRVKLNEEYAMEKVPAVGWHIFAYFEDEGEIRQDPHAGHVVLDERGMAELVAAFCEHAGGCDELQDCEAALELERNSRAVAYWQGRRRENAKT